VNSRWHCYGSHSLVARGFGIDEGVFKNLVNDVDLAPVDPRLKPILRYVRKLTETPNRMTQADADAIYQAGWSDEALFRAVAVCAYFNNMNRLGHRHRRDSRSIRQWRATTHRPRLRRDAWR
jgi:alkylhydroperoxidase family enzyme